jgi:osmotically inducible protein OsmC
MAKTSRATAVWEGKLRDGKGRFEAASGEFSGSYSFPTRFEAAKGTNPEELLAAAHAACLSMALAFGLEQAGTPAAQIATNAAVTIDSVSGGFRITKIRLEVRGQVPGLNQEQFANAAQAAKEGCPVSQLFKGNTTIELDAQLSSVPA